MSPFPNSSRTMIYLLICLVAAGCGAHARVTEASQAGGANCRARLTATRMPLPDPGCTPGATNPQVTSVTIRSTICVSGWTAKVRPPTSYTNRLKTRQLAAYGYAGADPRNFEEDHLIPLELGGSPTDPRNLWPEPWRGTGNARSKDRVETALKRAVCAGRVSLSAAQHAIATDWTTALTALDLVT